MFQKKRTSLRNRIARLVRHSLKLSAVTPVVEPESRVSKPASKKIGHTLREN